MLHLIQLSWHQECNGFTDDVSSIMWCQWHYMMLMPWHHVTPTSKVSYNQKSHAAFHFDLDLRNTMLPLMTPLELDHVDAGSNGIIWSKKSMLHLIWIILTSRIQWCHWKHKWHYMMPIPMVSHDQKSCSISFQSFSCHQHDMMPILVQMVSHNQMSCWASFWSSWLKKCYGSTDKVISMAWHQC